MKLAVSKRLGEKKSELTQLRHQGDIPAVVYANGKSSDKIAVKGDEFAAAVRVLPKGYLPTTVFELDIDEKTVKAFIKGIQYHPTTYRVLHLDFMVLDDITKVNVKVPIVCTGSAECVGVKLGGFIRFLKRHVKVRGLPKNIPTDLKLNIKDLGIGQSKRIGNIEFGNKISPLASAKEIVVVIAKR